MTANDRHTEDAARAAGEPLPGTPAASRSHEPTSESRELDRLITLLRSVEVPPSAERRGAVEERLRTLARTRTRRRIAVTAASLLVVLAPLYLLSRPREISVMGVVSGDVFHEVFVRRDGGGADLPESPPPTPAGASPNRPGFLRPFAEQAEFSLLVPVVLPGGAQLTAARFRRERPGIRPFSFLWLEYRGPGGRSIVLQASDSPEAEQAMAEPGLPLGWRSERRQVDGVLALVASPDLSREAISELAGRLIPFSD